jgi:tetratricopeptide (TPR) repeat protein
VTTFDSSPQPAPTHVPAIWGNIPQRNKNFTGRDQILESLRAGLASSVTAVLPHTLQGMGGVGKTQVAIEYAHRYRSEYDLVWWIPADQPALVRSSLAALAPQLGLEPATASGIGVEGAAAAVLNALRQGKPYDRWLLIFDNADQPEDLNDSLPRGPGDVLVTSRNHRWESVVEIISVDVFNRAESIEFLAKRVHGLATAEADAVAAELGDLPLALEQAGALMAETGMPVSEYLRLLKEQTVGILAEGKSPDYPLSMTAAWKLSVSTLEQHQPEAVALLRCCAFFGAEPIPRDLFPYGAAAVTSLLGDLLADPIRLARAIRELGRFALVRIEGRTIVMHRLIQALLRDDLPPGQEAVFREAAHLILAAGAPKEPNDSRQWPRFAELVGHLAAPWTQIEQSADATVRDFAMNMVRYLYNSGDLDASREFSERYVKQWSSNTDASDRTLLRMQRHVGNTLRGLGLYLAAKELDEETLNLSRDAFGEQDSLTLSCTNSYGADLRAAGDFADALEHDLSSLALHKEVLGPRNERTLRVANNLAVDYGLNSRYAEARDLHSETYRLRREVSTEISALELLSSWTGLARALRLCGSYEEARDVGQEAYDFGSTEIGAEHPRTLEAAIDLSIALRLIAVSSEDAAELANTVFEQATRSCGPSSPLTLAATLSLANFLRTRDHVSEALTMASESLERYRDIYGPDHPYSNGCEGNVAVLNRVNGDATSARSLNERALAGLDMRLGRDHHYSLAVAVNLASDLASLGDHAAARDLGEDTLPRLRHLLGEDHPLTLGCAANLVADLRSCSASVEAEQLFTVTMNRYREVLGDDHPDMVAAGEGRRLDFDFDSPQI